MLWLFVISSKGRSVPPQGGMPIPGGHTGTQSSFTIPKEIKDKLNTQGFAIVQTGERNIYDLYEQCKKHNEPILVTTDLILHTSHILFDYTLRAIELKTLLPKLEKLTQNMIEASRVQEQEAKNELVKSAALDNLAFFGVAAVLVNTPLLSGLPEKVYEKINKEIELINAHETIASSPIFEYYEDYTQYIPRGHYTRNYDFERYFKTMMWYGRMGFYLNPNQTMYGRRIDTKKEGIRLTKMAIIITKILTSSPELKRLWNEIYEPTIYFTGKSDDYTFQQYSTLIKNVDIAKDSSVISFINKAFELPPPLIISAISEDTTGLRGFKFMGQRFIPDSWIFQNLVYPRVGNYEGTGLSGSADSLRGLRRAQSGREGRGEPFTLEMTPLGPLRCFPRGLDLMSVLGSKVASDILACEGDTEYKNYDEQVKNLKLFFDGLPPCQWEETLYWRWLYILKLLVIQPHPVQNGYPVFMQSNAWLLKELNTALGSWAELRHDTILYAKQSYTMLAVSMPKPPEFTKGWVEPYPEIYKLMSEFAKNLADITICPKEVKKNLNDYSKILVSFSEISKKELLEEDLSDEEYKLIWNIGRTLKGLTIFSEALMKQITSGTDEKMAVIADVHTDPNSQKVLEEGVGYANTIYVKLGYKIVKGGIFSYYEFKTPMSERYTDEKWQNELVQQPRELQKWFVPLLK